MGSIGFVEEKWHYSPERGLNDLINELADSPDFAAPERESHARHLNLGRCLKSFNKYTKTSYERSIKIAKKDTPETNVVNYVDAGQKGYYAVTATAIKDRRRGKKYYIGQPSNILGRNFSRITGTASFESKKEAVDRAKKYAVKNPEINTFVINERDVNVASIVLECKYYKNKPKLAKKSWREIYPARLYIYSGSCHIG